MADVAWDIDVPTTQERALLVLLEDYGADEGWVEFRMDRLKLRTCMSEPRVKQAANTLWGLGRLRYEKSRGGNPSRWRIYLDTCVEVPDGVPPFPKYGASFKDRPQPEGTEDAARPFKDAAHKVTQDWYADTHPRPVLAGGFPAAMKLVERLLEAGWADHQVADALRDALVPTLASLEFSLRKSSRPVSPASGQPVASTTKPPKQMFCPHCGSSGSIRSPQGLRCVRCNELWEV
jgi:hypothetical protein